MDRIILHSDLNNFYASVECLRHPELRELPIAVGGSVEERHGIVLAKNELAKRFGVKTGEALWLARQKCPGLTVVQPNHKLYGEFSQKARELYLSYTDRVEPFGLDEAWLDVTALRRDGCELANELRNRMKDELGLTVSVGVSFNKVFAKLGSDIKKPDAVTLISRENYREVVWKNPTGALLYVGPATVKKLESYGIKTIGQLAEASPDTLNYLLGKMGGVLHRFANGQDSEPVAEFDALMTVKSIGNSSTGYRDLANDEDAKMMFYMLADTVAARVRGHGFCATTLTISVRDCELNVLTRQCQLERPSNLSGDYAATAMLLLRKHYHWGLPIRSVGLSVSGFTHDDDSVQLDLMLHQQRHDELEKLERAVDTVRKRFGSAAVQRAVLLQDRHLTGGRDEE